MQYDIETKYTCGLCYPFAIALNNAIGGKIVALVADLPTGKRHIAHSFCQDNDGNYYDARGVISIELIEDLYIHAYPGRTVSHNFIHTNNGDEFLSLLTEVVDASEHEYLFEYISSIPKLIDMAADEMQHLRGISDLLQMHNTTFSPS